MRCNAAMQVDQRGSQSSCPERPICAVGRAGKDPFGTSAAGDVSGTIRVPVLALEHGSHGDPDCGVVMSTASWPSLSER